MLENDPVAQNAQKFTLAIVDLINNGDADKVSKKESS